MPSLASIHMQICDPGIKLATLLSLLSGAMLGMSFLFPNLFVFTWFAFVPFLLALRLQSLGRVYFLALCSGIACVVTSSYWIEDFIFNLKGYAAPLRYLLSIAFWFFSAHIFVALAFFYRGLKSAPQVSSYLAFPTALTLAFAFFPLMFSVQLGGSQSAFLLALQGIEFTGVYGLDFVIGLCNIVFFNLIVRAKVEKKATALALSSLALWFGFGAYAVDAWDRKTSGQNEIRVGIVQINEAPSVDIIAPPAGFSYAYPMEMGISESLARAGADFIVWPEARHRGYFAQDHVSDAYRYHAAQLGRPIIFQDNETEIEEGQLRRFNTSVLLNGSGAESGKYRKIKRIPIGEYLPVFNNSVSMKQVLREHLGDFFSDLQPGDRPEAYTLNDSLTLVPLICYELIFPRFVARAVPERSHPIIMIGQSNNGWFGDTRQPFQHLYASVLRSVENRVPLVHAVNNGPSAAIWPNGRIVAQTSYREAGGFMVSLPLNNEASKTVFGRYPFWFLGLLCIAAVLMSIAALQEKVREKVGHRSA